MDTQRLRRTGQGDGASRRGEQDEPQDPELCRKSDTCSQLTRRPDSVCQGEEPSVVSQGASRKWPLQAPKQGLLLYLEQTHPSGSHSFTLTMLSTPVSNRHAPLSISVRNTAAKHRWSSSAHYRTLKEPVTGTRTPEINRTVSLSPKRGAHF